ncbi:protein of unknown function [Streptomyces murinus]
MSRVRRAASPTREPRGGRRGQNRKPNSPPALHLGLAEASGCKPHHPDGKTAWAQCLWRAPATQQ